VTAPLFAPAQNTRPMFGWIVTTPTGERVRSLGIVAELVEVEWIDRRGMPREWLALNDERVRTLRRHAHARGLL
jgi:hypothetical protein